MLNRYYRIGRVCKPPPIEWFIRRAREGTPVTHAAIMMREEGYSMSNGVFRMFYSTAQDAVYKHERNK